MFDNLELIPPEAFTSLGSVAEKIIDKISNAIGWIVMPKGNHKNLLDAETYLIEQIKEDEKMPLMLKAASISNARKMIKEYENQSEILYEALNYIGENVIPEKVEDDWLSYFFDKAKNVSRSDVQRVWAKLLAKEFNEPGSVSKALIHILSIIDNEAAQKFTKLADFSYFLNGTPQVLIYMLSHTSIYSKYGLLPGDILYLEDIGLLQSDSQGYVQELEKGDIIEYFDNRIQVESSKTFRVGNTLLSKAGEELLSIITEKEKIAEFEEIFLKTFSANK